MVSTRIHGVSWSAGHARILLVVVISSFILRLGVALVIDATTDVYKDVDIYSKLASNISQGNGFVAESGGDPIMHRAPLYPAFLAIIHSLFDEQSRTLAIIVAQAILDSLTAALLWWIGCQLFGSTVGLFAAWLFAAYPLSAYYTLRLMPEPLFTFFLIAFVAGLVQAMRSETIASYGLCGALAGIATLVKPITIALAPFVAILLLVRQRRSVRHVLPRLAVMVCMSVLVIAPWTARNFAVSGAFVPVSTGGGAALWVGNNRISDGHEDDEIRDEAQLEAFIKRRREIVMELVREKATSRSTIDKSTDQAHYRPGAPMDTTLSHNAPVNIDPDVDRAFAHAAIEEMMESPLDAMGLLLRKFFRFWFDIYLPENRWAQPIIYVVQSVLLLLACYGVLVAMRSKVPVTELLAPIMYLALMYSLIVSTLRYSIPLTPILMLLAFVGVADIGMRLGIWSVPSTRESERTRIG